MSCAVANGAICLNGMRKREYVEDVLHVLSLPVPSDEAAKRAYERALIMLEVDHDASKLWKARTFVR
jgi:hypothetical protein